MRPWVEHRAFLAVVGPAEGDSTAIRSVYLSQHYPRFWGGKQIYSLSANVWPSSRVQDAHYRLGRVSCKQANYNRAVGVRVEALDGWVWEGTSMYSLYEAVQQWYGKSKHITGRRADILIRARAPKEPWWERLWRWVTRGC